MGFCQLVWRPRPQSLLTREQLKDVKKYSDQFNAKDKMRQSRASKELVAKRQALADAFNSWRDKKIREFKETRDKRLELRGGLDLHEGEGFEEETVEFLVKEESTILQD